MADSGMIDLVINLVLKVSYPQDVYQLAVILVSAYFNRNRAAFLFSLYLLLEGINKKKFSSWNINHSEPTNPIAIQLNLELSDRLTFSTSLTRRYSLDPMGV